MVRWLNRLFRVRAKPARIKEKMPVQENITAVLKDVRTGEKKVIKGKNIVCNGGDKYYAQMAANETPDYAYATSGRLKLGKGTTTPAKGDTDIETEISGTCKLASEAYPKTNDTDPDNGSGSTDTVTWKFYYDTSEAIDTNISECALASECAIPPNELLMHGLFDSPFNKTGSQTLTIFINHRFNGV